jgi:hypothetical protein
MRTWSTLWGTPWVELKNPFCCCTAALLRGCADLYHLDHFLGAIKTACGALVDCKSFTILPGPPEDPLKPLEPLLTGSQAVYVAVQDSKGADAGVFELRMVQRQQGLKAGCWMTKSCLRVK